MNADPTVVPVAIYTRKSTNHNMDLEMNSIESQRQYCESFVKAHAAEGWEVVADRYDDPAYSGKDTSRPAFKRLMADAKAGKFKVIVFYKLDRLSRNLRDFLDITAALEECGVRLACVAHPIDTGTAAGRAFVNLMAVFGQLEREQSAERVADTFQAIRKRGGYIGGCTPFGYLVQDKHLVPDPERRDVVRKMFECFLQTASEKAVAAMVEECGATRRDGRPWNLSYVGRILRNRVYCGEVMFRGEPVQAEHEALVPKELWEAVNNLIKEHAEASAARPCADQRSTPHPLAGLVRCGHCGGAMSPSSTHSRHDHSKVYRYFACRNDAKRPHSLCPLNRVPAGELEAVVVGQLGEVLRAPAFVSLVAESLNLAPAEVIRKLENVTEFWTGLFPAERWRLMRLLVDRVTVRDGEVEIKIRTHGVESVIEEIRNAHAD